MHENICIGDLNVSDRVSEKELRHFLLFKRAVYHMTEMHQPGINFPISPQSRNESGTPAGVRTGVGGPRGRRGSSGAAGVLGAAGVSHLTLLLTSIRTSSIMTPRSWSPHYDRFIILNKAASLRQTKRGTFVSVDSRFAAVVSDCRRPSGLEYASRGA